MGRNMMMKNNLNGRNDIHVRFISRSYRIRGIVARTEMKRVASAMVFRIRTLNDRFGLFMFWKTNKAVIIDIKMMFIYSAIKMKANVIDEYSVLNPDTNSLSPSAKSKGERLVSARSVVNQINVMMGEMSHIFIVEVSMV